MSEKTYHVTDEENRKKESRESKMHGGNTPADTEPSLIKSKTDHSTQPTKSEKIDRVKANLPLPDDPPVASDWNSADGRTVNVGSGRVQDEVSEMAKGGESGLRGPATAESSVRVDGGEWKKATAP